MNGNCANWEKQAQQSKTQGPRHKGFPADYVVEATAKGKEDSKFKYPTFWPKAKKKTPCYLQQQGVLNI